MYIPKTVKEYLKKIGLKDNKTDLKKQFIKEFGAEGAELYSQYIKIEKENENVDINKKYASNQRKIVDFANLNITLAMITEGYFNYDIHVNFLTWLYGEQELFGKEIIDLGCGSGITSCFIASILPESHVVAIDESENAIKVANAIKTKLGINNIDFICQNVQKLADKKYDTVLSTRFIHETIGRIFPAYSYLMPSQNIKIAAKMHHEIVCVISNLLKENGNIICIERYPDEYAHNMFYYGLLQEFNDNGFNLPDTLIYLDCREDTGITRFPAIVLQKGNDRVNVLEMYEKTKETFISKIHKFEDDDNFYSLEGMEAKLILEDVAGELVEGFHTEDALGTWCGMGALYKYKYKNNYYVAVQQNKLKINVTKLIGKEKEEAILHFKSQKRADKQNGFSIVESIQF